MQKRLQKIPVILMLTLLLVSSLSLQGCASQVDGMRDARIEQERARQDRSDRLQRDARDAGERLDRQVR
ncbi:hypothetical protein [Marinospirillum sp.]|uniref:hypothetical protein n=1 Tax=Marinospirillum sp. TaxID=2183934 RepID=UPI003A893FBC